MAYTPPVYNAVYFNGAGSAYAAPLYNEVFFEPVSTNLSIPSATIEFLGRVPAIQRTLLVAVPAAEITFAGVAPAGLILVGRSYAVPAADIAFAGVAPAISGGRQLAVPAANITFAGGLPTITATAGVVSGYSHRTHAGGAAMGGVVGYSHFMVLGGIGRIGGGPSHRTVLGGIAKEGPNTRDTALHEDVRLYVPFTGNVDTDLSIYANTATQTGATIANTRLEVYSNVDPASPHDQYIQYENSGSYGLDYDGSSGWTVEMFVTLNDANGNTNPGEFWTMIFETGASAYITGQYSTAGDVYQDDSGFGTAAGPTTSHPLAPIGTKYHVCLCRNAGSGAQNEYLYVDGVNVLTLSYSRSASPAGDGIFKIGGRVNTNGFGTKIIDYYLGETRIVARALYPNGTSFTAPTEGNLSVIS